MIDRRVQDHDVADGDGHVDAPGAIDHLGPVVGALDLVDEVVLGRPAPLPHMEVSATAGVVEVQVPGELHPGIGEGPPGGVLGGEVDVQGRDAVA